MITEIQHKNGDKSVVDSIAAINYYHGSDHLGSPAGISLNLEYEQEKALKLPRVRVILSFTETRLLAHRLLRAIGDRA